MLSPLFKIGSFTVLVWHAVAAAGVVLLLILIIALAVSASKKKKAKGQNAEEADKTEISGAEKENDTESVRETTEADGGEMDAAPDDGVRQEETANETPAREEPSDEENGGADSENPVPDAETQEDEDKNAKARPKNYHVSLRDDGKWQVKLSKGGRALKLFDTQAEAIDFAKAKAKNQDGYITIHKTDGKIRKQKY